VTNGDDYGGKTDQCRSLCVKFHSIINLVIQWFASLMERREYVSGFDDADSSLRSESRKA